MTAALYICLSQPIKTITQSRYHLKFFRTLSCYEPFGCNLLLCNNIAPLRRASLRDKKGPILSNNKSFAYCNKSSYHFAVPTTIQIVINVDFVPIFHLCHDLKMLTFMLINFKSIFINCSCNLLMTFVI